MREAEVSMLRDRFVKQRLQEGTYTSGQVDKDWKELPQKIKDDYQLTREPPGASVLSYPSAKCY